ncbi:MULTISPECIES: glycosyltransferase [Bacteroides]|uniref:glycosyltransferase n=1 Tax=Bacteroides TaxID=816 RepID=UPI000E44DE9F|nr:MULTISPECIES: glycosyltransferase [Bacteroides]MBS7575677.1 glycosyltransferase [Bacteroides propionicigenes]RGM25602.1 glycosyltransferase [Bacteroides sp. OM08-17BH]HBO06981.1 hypothetical protein [Bacteroides sp.]
MKILFDLISIQKYHSGGGEYVKKVLDELLSKSGNVIFGLFNSRLSFLDKDLENLRTKIQLLDISKNTISEYVRLYEVDILFVGIIQRYIAYNLENIECRIVCVMHDIGDMEFLDNRIHFLSQCSLKNYLRLSVDYWFPRIKYSTLRRTISRYQKIESFLLQDNVTIITVSQYTANSIKYYFPKIGNKKHINILYPPSKQYIRKNIIDNSKIDMILASGKKYILFVNANRENKNFNIVLKCFNRVKEIFPDMLLVVTGKNRDISNKDIIGLNYVSTSDIENLYMHAWALIYPSLTEGFGYPPIEAMKYGTPVISSNVCSMPEILDDAALYCSPFYVNDLFYRIRLLEERYQWYKLKSEEQYQKILKRQKEDLHILIDMISN